MRSRQHQRGYLLITIVVALFLVATVAVLLAHSSAISANTASRELESARAGYVAQAGMQHALWRTQNNACMGNMTIPATALGADSYDVQVTGAAAGTAYALAVDQDAWIRSDDVTSNNGTNADQHIRFESGNTEHTLTRFDLSSIPADAQINSAIALFYVTTSGAGGGAHPEGPVTVHRVTADWTETGATWENMNGSFEDSTLATIAAQPVDDVWISINLTAQVQAWANGQPNYGVLMRSLAEGVHGKYSSREDGGNAPRLDVVVGSGTASPVAVKAIGTLANGVKRKLKDKVATAYQPPGTVTLQLGTDLGADAMIDSFYERNYGGSDYLQINDESNWQQRPLLRFSLGAIPYGAQVLSATLELNNSSTNTAGIATVHQLTRSFVEGTRAGGGTADGATWATYDGSTAWSSTGGDFDPAPVAEANVDTASGWVSWNITSLVDTWLNGTTNNGVLIRSTNGLKQAKFASGEAGDPTLRPRLTITFACECGGACMAPQGSGNILMVVDDQNAPSAGDLTIKSYFEAWGYTVNLISDDVNQNTYDSNFLINDVVYVSESIDPVALSTKLSAAPIGVVSADADLNNELGIASEKGAPVGSALEVVDTSHYITQVFPAGPLSFKTVATQLASTSATKSPDAKVLATADGQDALVALESGAVSTKGGTVTSRRVLLPVGDSDVSWSYLTNNGHLLVQRSLAWAIGANAGSSGKLLMVVADAGSPTTSETDRKSLIESWGYAVTLISDHALQAEFDTALLDADVAYITGSGSSTAVGTKLTGATVGVLSEDIGLVDELGIAQPSFLKRSSQSIEIFDNTHYVTSGFSLGTLQLYSYVPGIWTVTGLYAPGLEVLAGTESSGSSFPPGLALLEAGAELYGGGFAAGRRVQVPWSDGSFDINALNADGRTIMQRAIEWGAGAGAAACTSTSPLLFVVGDAAAPTSQETARRTLLESWCYDVTLIDDSESQANFDTAAANVDVAYISSEVSASALGTKLKDKSIGIVNEDPDLHNDYGFSTVRYRSTTNAPIGTDSAHYITSPFAGADITLFTSTQPAGAAVGTLPSGLVTIGTWTSGDLAPLGGLLTLDTGAAISGGGTAAGRRVQMPWDGAEGSAVADVGALTADGEAVLQRSLEWAAGLDISTGPIAHWKLDETSGTTAVDSEGGHDGTLIMGQTWGVGQIDGGLDFDGVDDIISVGAPAALDDVFSGGGTATAWIYPRGTGANNSGRVVDKWNSNTNGWLFTLYGESLLVQRGFSGAVGTWHSAAGSIQMDTWQHVAVVYDDSSDANVPVLYIDGIPQALTEMFAPSGTSGSDAGIDLNIGDRSVGSTRRTFDGILDDVRIYDRTLSPSEVSELAAMGGSGGGGGSGAAPVFEEFTEASASSNVTSLNVAKPGGTVAGDLLIAALATDGDSATSFSPPSGWTPVNVGMSADNRVSFGIWWKIASGSESSQYTFTWSGGEEAYGWVSRFTGHDPGSPILYDAGALTNSSTSAPICQKLITPVDDMLVLRLGGFDDDDITVGDPGLVGHTAINMGESGSGSGTVSGGSGYMIQATAGDSDFAWFQLTNNEQMRTVTLGIRPAP